MDAQDFFDQVVQPNYADAIGHPDDFGLVWNAIVCMNTVAEFVALHQLGYPENLTRSDLAKKAKQIRDSNPPLDALKFEVETLKHVRKLTDAKNNDHAVTASSTGHSLSDPASWRPLGDLLRRAFETFKTFPELR
jgi:hypothetical protein